MRVLGIDPGSSIVGWACFDDGKLEDHGSFRGDPRFAEDWKRRRDGLMKQISHILREKQADVVAIEETQVVTARTDSRKPLSAQAVSGMNVNTRRTEELAGMIGMEAQVQANKAKRQVSVVRVHPATGLARLHLRRGASDRQISERFTLIFGKKLLVKDHHEALAAGVAMAAEQRAKMERLTGRKSA